MSCPASNSRVPARNPGPGFRRFLVAALVCVLAGSAAPAASPGTPNPLEYEVKAAMLYNFIRFIEWPPTAWKDPHGPFIVGIFGSDPFGKSLDQTLQDKTYSGRPIQIRRLHALSEAEGCNVLFVARSEKKHLPEIIRSAQSAAILTVSDIDEFVQAGGAIGFVLVDSKIRFEINSASASKSGLTISSKLLRLSLSNDRRGGGK